tara:strand:- start:3366 stop:3701 length:336 start_codon:yes stop_codon:yes gene_type:complete
MSHSLYNLFTPTRHLNPRASGLMVFGGGAEEGYAQGGVASYAAGGIAEMKAANTALTAAKQKVIAQEKAAADASAKLATLEQAVVTANAYPIKVYADYAKKAAAVKSAERC